MRRPMGVLVLVIALAIGACAAPGPSGPAATAPPDSTSPAPPAASPSPSRAATSPRRSPTVEPFATPSGTATVEARWQRIGAVEKAPDAMGGWRRLAGSALGYVAIAAWPPALWFSKDGVTWSRTALKVPHGTALTAEAVAATDDRIVVGGSYSPCKRAAYERNPFGDCRPRPVSWTSTDGRTWTASGTWKGPIGEEGRSGSLFNAVWPVPGGGWDIAQVLNPSDESDDFEYVGPSIWHSPDGLAWTKLTPLPSDDAECGSQLQSQEVVAGADEAGRRVAAGGETECGPEVWTSADGRTYAPSAGFAAQAPSAAVNVVLHPADRLPWRLFGWPVRGDDGDAGPPTLWRSADLVAWTAIELPTDGVAGGVVLAATHAPGMDVAIGWTGGGQYRTWIGDAAGDWRLATGKGPAIEAVANGPAGVLGLVGVWDAAGDVVAGFEVWQLVIAG